MKNDREKSRGLFVVDPSIPRQLCQKCRHPLSIVGTESYAEKIGAELSRSGVPGVSMYGTGSILEASRMDHSFVVLPEQRNQTPCPRTGGNQYPGSPPVAALNHPVHHAVGPSNKDTPEQAARSSKSSLTVLKSAFDIVSSQTQVEQPLCLECMRVMSENLDRELEDINNDIKAYEASLKFPEEEYPSGINEANFLQEKEKVEEEENKLKAAIEEFEKQCTDFRHQPQELELKSKRFEELEERYWHEFNDYRLQLTTHQEERDAILAKIVVTQTQLEQLKRTNVLNDAFDISRDGEFGTICNFRLGRLPNNHVEWDEINAAWGQACFLLHTMAMQSGANFSYRIVPMGSYPCILDSTNNKYNLFGPVNLFWSSFYDNAIRAFLTCLKEFGDYANAKDRAENFAPDKCFKFPKKIENGKVGNFTITQSFNRLEDSTEALKWMLCDLKWALHWFTKNIGFQPPGTASMASRASSLH